MKRKMAIVLCVICALVAALPFFAACDFGWNEQKPDPTVSFAASTMTLTVGETADAGITFTGAESVTVTVNPEGIVRYADGKITALKAGTAIVTASVGDVKAEMTVTVNDVPAKKVTVTIGDKTVEAEIGSKLDKPADPEKESTEQYDYVFDGWYNGDEKWDFDNDTVEGEMTLVAKFTETLRKYQVNFDGEFVTVEYGSKLEKPADPQKPSTSNYDYVFDKWVIFGTDTAWDFENDVVTGNVDLEPVFIEKAKEYSYTYRIVSATREFLGKNYELYEIKDEDISVVVSFNGEEYSRPAVENGMFTVSGVKGNYDVEITWQGIVTERICRLQTDGQADIEVSKPLEIGGSAGELPSFGQGYEVQGDSIKITSTSYAYISGEQPTETLYMEADVAFASGVGKMVGFMPAAEHAVLEGNGANKLIFSYSGGNRLYYQEVAGWSGSGITDIGFMIDQNFAPITGCKIAVARLDNDYYILINDKVMAHYYTESFGAGDFGFCSTAAGVDITFDNVAYTVNRSIVEDILASKQQEIDLIGDKGSYLGGSFTYPGGNTYTSFNSGWGLSGVNSGYMNATTYLYANGAVGNIYYQEAEFTKENGWVGLLVNTLDYEPQKNKGWYGYGVYCGNQLYLHEYDGSWENGTLKTNINTGSGDTFKLGVARVNDWYYVFINDALVLQEKVTAYSTSDRSALPADNASGMGLFRGSNFSGENKRITFTDYRYSFDLDEIRELVGGSATIECGENITMEQCGIAVENGDTLMPGAAVTIKIDVPEGKVIKNYTLTHDGKTVSVELSGNNLVFTPESDGKYLASVEFTDKGVSSLNLTVKSVERGLDGVMYPLYDLDIDWSQVKVALLNLTAATEQTFGMESAEKVLSGLDSGYYKISISYNSNVYTDYLTLEAGADAEYTGYVSGAYLGGTITIPNASGTETTYNSFDNASPTATSGSNWTLVDGRRDTIRVTNYTYAFQHQFAGTKYYVEGTFDTNDKINIGSNFGGLLVAHGPGNLTGESDKKFEVAISGQSVIATYIPDNWSPLNTFVIANFEDLGIDYDPSAVRLGVVRDGTHYWFFVNDVYVGQYVLEDITNECGVGVSASLAINLTISNFNASDNEQLIEAYKAAAPVRENKQIDVYLIAGQSNASGCTNVNLDTAAAANDNYLYGYNNIWYAGNAGANWMHEVNLGLARVGLGEDAGKMGPEIGMAEALSAYYNTESGKEAAIIKYAVGGTNLLDNVGGLNASDGNWCPPTYFETHNKVHPTLSGGLYTKFFIEFDKQWSILKAMGYTPVVKGLYWMQGEADKGSPSQYLEVFEMFAADIRKDLTAHSGQDCYEMPIFIGEISRTSGDASPATVNTNNAFIAMQRTIPAHVNDTYVIANGDLDINIWQNNQNVVVGSDTWHWSWQDAIKIGNMVGESILKNVLGQN